MSSEGSYQSAELLSEDFRAGRVSALQEIYNLHHRSLWFFANSIIRDQEKASDIVADCFLKMWEKHKQFTTLERIPPYLFRSVRNACISQIRQSRRRSESHSEVAYLSDVSDEQISSYQLHAELLQLAMTEAAHLPEKMRAVFELLYRDGLSIAETAARLNISVTTVSAQKINAIERIRNRLIKKGMLGISLLLISYL
jgi:RNA polymerase sigma-70 factor (family 1)